MKHQLKLLLFLSIFISSLSYAQNANFGIYGINKHESLSEYKDYKNQIVKYIPQTKRSAHDRYFKKNYEIEYLITDITKSGSKIIIHLIEKNGKKKIKYPIYSESKYSTKYPSAPLLLIEKFKKDQTSLVGAPFINKKTGKTYQLTELKIVPPGEGQNKQKEYPQLYYSIKSQDEGEIIDIPVSKALDGRYVSTLTKVIKPADETIRHGDMKVIQIDSITKFNYNDDHIDILIFNTSKEFSFNLKNISKNTLRIIWNDAAFVDFDGSTSRVIHKGIKYSEMEKDQPATIVIAGSNIDDIAVPTSNIKFLSLLGLSEWYTTSLFPIKPEENPGELKLMLPIQVKETINEYIFVFEVKWENDYPVIKNKN